MIKDWRIAETIEGLDYDCLKIVNINNKNESIILGQENFTVINMDKIITKEYADIMEVNILKRLPVLAQTREIYYEPIFNELKITLTFETETIQLNFGTGAFERQKTSEDGIKDFVSAIKKSKPLIMINEVSKGVLI